MILASTLVQAPGYDVVSTFQSVEDPPSLCSACLLCKQPELLVPTLAQAPALSPGSNLHHLQAVHVCMQARQRWEDRQDTKVTLIKEFPADTPGILHDVS